MTPWSWLYTYSYINMWNAYHLSHSVSCWWCLMVQTQTERNSVSNRVYCLTEDSDQNHTFLKSYNPRREITMKLFYVFKAPAKLDHLPLCRDLEDVQELAIKWGENRVDKSRILFPDSELSDITSNLRDPDLIQAGR